MGDSPLLWIDGPPRISQKGRLTIIDGDDHVSTRDKIFGASFFLLGAGFMLLWSLGVYIATSGVLVADDDDHAAFCDDVEDYNLTLGANPLYCGEVMVRESVAIEISEDQHVRERSYCHVEYEGEEECAEEYRWENIDIFVVYGFIDDEGRYRCDHFLSSAELPDDWRVEDIDDDFSYPEWCDSTDTNQENRTYEEGAHPHDGVWLYWGNVEDMRLYVEAIKFEDGQLEVQWLRSVETMGSEGFSTGASNDSDDDFGRWALCCTVPLGLLFLLGVDRRRDVLVLDRENEKITRKRAGWLPSIPEVWSDASFKNARARSKSFASWETENNEAQSGFEVVLPVEDEGEETLLFVDLSKSSEPQEKIMKQVLAAMGAEQSATEPMGDVNENKPKKSKPVKGGPWGYKPAEGSTPSSASAGEDQGTDAALMDSFWSVDEAGEP